MTRPLDRPKICHITYVDNNLARIVADGGLVSDREILARGGPARAIGMSSIKRRRVEELKKLRQTGGRRKRRVFSEALR